MRLYGHPISTCTRKVLTVLHEKGIPFEFTVVNLFEGEQKQPEHLQRQPFGLVPAIDDDGFKMFESRAIIRYLDKKLPGPKLTPADPRGQARMDEWMSVEQSYFTPGALAVIKELYLGKMAGQEPDMDRVAQSRPAAEKALDVAERALATRPYFAGEEFSLADISWMPYVQYLFPCGLSELISSRPAVLAWWERVSARPSWVKVSAPMAS